MIRIGIQQGFDNGTFGRVINFCNVVVIGLAANLEGTQILRGSIDDGGSLARGLDCNV